MPDHPKPQPQADPQAGHAQSVDPMEQALQTAAQRPAASDAAFNAGIADQMRMQEVLPEIRALAQRVGGLKQLAEIIASLQESSD